MPSQNFISATDARKDFFDLLAGLKRSPYPVAIIHKGQPEGVLMSWEDYNGWIATIETLTDPELMASIRQGQEEIKQGRTRPWKEIRKELGLNDGLSGAAHQSGGKRAKKA